MTRGILIAALTLLAATPAAATLVTFDEGHASPCTPDYGLACGYSEAGYRLTPLGPNRGGLADGLPYAALLIAPDVWGDVATDRALYLYGDLDSGVRLEREDAGRFALDDFDLGPSTFAVTLLGSTGAHLDVMPSTRGRLGIGWQNLTYLDFWIPAGGAPATLDDLRLTGAAVAVAAPSAFVLILAGALGLALTRRR